MVLGFFHEFLNNWTYEFLKKLRQNIFVEEYIYVNFIFVFIRLHCYPLARVDIKTKCRHLRKLTCQETLRQVFIRVYRLERQSVMLVFSTQLCELYVAPLAFSLVQLSPLSPFPV